jgi:hypothetical protein
MSEEVFPSPKFQMYCVTVVVSVERLLNWKLLPLIHCVVSLMENLVLGDKLTVMFLDMESAQANPEVAMSVTEKIPVALYL